MTAIRYYGLTCNHRDSDGTLCTAEWPATHPLIGPTRATAAQDGGWTYVLGPTGASFDYCPAHKPIPKGAA